MSLIETQIETLIETQIETQIETLYALYAYKVGTLAPLMDSVY